MYLDIGANGRITSDTAWIGATAEVSVTEDRVNRYGVPAGVDFAPVGTVGDPDAAASLTGDGTASFSRSGDTVTGNSGSGLTQTVTFLRDDEETADAAYSKNGETLTAPEVTPDTYNETDWLDAEETQPALDTYGVNHQSYAKTVTIRVHDDNIEDQFTFSYSYGSDGVSEDADDPVTVRYADPLVYMIQYDSGVLDAAPTLDSVGSGFRGTIYLGVSGENSTLTQIYPSGSKTIRPSDKVNFQAYPGTELFRVYGDPENTISAAYSSVMNGDKTQNFTYSVAGTDLEEPIIADENSGCATTAANSSAATLTWTLAAPVDTSLLSVRNFTPVMLSTTSRALTADRAMLLSVSANTANDELSENYVAEIEEEEEEPAIFIRGSIVEYDAEEHVTRYYEWFPDHMEAEDGWLLVLEVYDEGYGPKVKCSPQRGQHEQALKPSPHSMV